MSRLTALWHFWSFRIPLHGRKILLFSCILQQKNVRWDLEGKVEVSFCGEKRLWKMRSVQRIETCEVFRKPQFQSRNGNDSFSQPDISQKGRCEFDHDRIYQAWSYWEKSLNVDIYQYWEHFGFFWNFRTPTQGTKPMRLESTSLFTIGGISFKTCIRISRRPVWRAMS